MWYCAVNGNEVVDEECEPSQVIGGGNKSGQIGCSGMDSNPNCHAYGETAYWDRRYNEERRKHGINHSFDWYLPCEELWPIIQTYCGNNKAYKVRA